MKYATALPTKEYVRSTTVGAGRESAQLEIFRTTNNLRRASLNRHSKRGSLTAEKAGSQHSTKCSLVDSKSTFPHSRSSLPSMGRVSLDLQAALSNEGSMSASGPRSRLGRPASVSCPLALERTRRRNRPILLRNPVQRGGHPTVAQLPSDLTTSQTSGAERNNERE
jgi:hypothetical protein